MEPNAAFWEKMSDWKGGFPPSIRLLNTALIAEALQRSTPAIRIPDPTALADAINTEKELYSTSSQDSDYLAKVNQYLQTMRPDSKDSQGASSREEIPVPGSYIMTEPITRMHMVLRYSMPGYEELGLGTRALDRKDHPSGPYESLLQRHGQITHCVQKLLDLFLCKLHTIQSIQASTPFGTVFLLNTSLTDPMRKLCDDSLIKFLKEVGENLKSEEKQSEDVDLKTKYLEGRYMESIEMAFSTFIEFNNKIFVGKVEDQAQLAQDDTSRLDVNKNVR